MKLHYDDAYGLHRVHNGRYEACSFRKCADGVYAVEANDILCFAVMDDFGNLVRVQ